MADASMKLYNEKEELYLKANVLGVGFKAGLLQARNGMWLSKDAASDNSSLWSIAF